MEYGSYSIANIEGSIRATSVKVGCFLFSSKTNKMTRGSLIQLPSCSPLRHSISFKDRFKQGSEANQEWDNFVCYSRNIYARNNSIWWLKRVKVHPEESDVENAKLCSCVCEIKTHPDTSLRHCLLVIVCRVCWCCRYGISKCFHCLFTCIRSRFYGLAPFSRRITGFR